MSAHLFNNIHSVARCDFSEWLIVEMVQTFRLLLERRAGSEGIEWAGPSSNEISQSHVL